MAASRTCGDLLVDVGTGRRTPGDLLVDLGTGCSGSVHGVTEPTAEPRTPTAVDAVADAYFDAAIDASPIEATYLGVPGRDAELDDLSPDGFAHHADLARQTLAALDGVSPWTPSTG